MQNYTPTQFVINYRNLTAYASSKAAIPGKTLPSSNSKLAPPPVEIWLIWSAKPTFSTAATESPPPIMVVAPVLPISAKV